MIHLCNTCGCKDAESFDAEYPQFRNYKGAIIERNAKNRAETFEADSYDKKKLISNLNYIKNDSQEFIDDDDWKNKFIPEAEQKEFDEEMKRDIKICNDLLEKLENNSVSEVSKYFSKLWDDSTDDVTRNSCYNINEKAELYNYDRMDAESFEAEVPILGKGKEFKQQQPLLPQKVIDRLREQSIIRDNLGGTFVGDFIAIRDSVGGYYKKGDKAKITILEEEADENYDEYDNYIGPLLYEINLVGGISLVADPVDFENNWVEGFGAETFEAKGIDTFTEPFGELRTGSILNKAILLGSLGAGAMIGLKLRK